MSFLEQPDEIIIEQLRYLPVTDLLNTCQTNSEVSRICAGRRLWDLRLIDEFGVRTRHDPKSHYLLLVLRRNLLNSILNRITPEEFNQNRQAFIDLFPDYQSFVDAQTNRVNSLSVEEIQRFNTTQTMLNDTLFHHEDAGISDVLVLFFSDSTLGPFRIISLS